MGETDKCLTDGADEEMQLLSCCVRIRFVSRIFALGLPLKLVVGLPGRLSVLR